MKSIKLSLLTCLIVFFFTSCGKKYHEVLLTTYYGNITIQLYDFTPLHTENFMKLVKEGFYDGTTFHRIVPGFVIQGGDPNTRKNSDAGTAGAGGPGYKIPAEIGAPHIYGAVGMARRDNPEKKSNGSQFYIVTGRKRTKGELQQIQRQKGITYSDKEIKLYLELGGTPTLDGEYTVFGRVIDGMDVVEKIQAAKLKNPQLPPVYMKAKLLN